MKHSNISIFIPHMGCPNKCSFCEQSIIASTKENRDIAEVEQEIVAASNNFKGDKTKTEIAFFGGSFTAIDYDYMIALLKKGQELCRKYQFKGIRISTRPDYIDIKTLETLKKYGVSAIELGAQSMDDKVLQMNMRGHSKDDVIKASKLIKENGFELGLQMMLGLYGEDENTAYQTAKQIIKIKPDTVRIYPTVILKNTYLEKVYKSGEYKTMPLNQAVKICSDIMLQFEQEHIKIIKVGLHSSTDVLDSMVGGIYHPAFRELCESEIYYKIIKESLDAKGEYKIYVLDKNISKALGQKRQNILKLANEGYTAKIIGDKHLSGREIRVERG